MDVDAVEKASRELAALASRLDDVVRVLDQTLRGLPAVWSGEDARHFVHTTWPAYRRRLSVARDGIEELSKASRENADAQRAASDSLEGSSSAGVSPSLSPLGAKWMSMTADEHSALPDGQLGAYGNADGLPARIRDEANRVALDRYLSQPRPAGPPEAVQEYDANRRMLLQAKEALDSHPDAQLLSLVLTKDGVPEHPQIAIGVGDVDHADHVAVYVQGWTTNPASPGGVTSPVQQMDDLRAGVRSELESSGRGDESVAVVTWMGYTAPGSDVGANGFEADGGSLGTFVGGVGGFISGGGVGMVVGGLAGKGIGTLAGMGNAAMPQYAESGGNALAEFVDGIRANNPDASMVAVGHSYGSTVVGYAAQHSNSLNGVVVAGSPGLLTDDARSLHVGGNVTVVENRGDPVADAGLFGRLGKDPSSLDGVNVVTTGSLTVDSAAAHTGYFDKGSDGFRAIVHAIAGQR